MNYSVDTDLLIKYFSGLASPEEAFRIDEWRKEQPEHELSFNELKAAWAAERGYQAPDIDLLWQQFSMEAGAKQVKARQGRQLLRWLPYAALLILVCGIGLWQYHKGTTSGNRVFTYSAANEEYMLKSGAIVRLMPGARLEEAITERDTLFTLTGTALFNFSQAFPGFRLRVPSGVNIRDIGTKFLVEGDEHFVKVTVHQGLVAAWYETDTIKVDKNEVLRFDKASGFTKTALTGNFDYKDYSLKKVCDSVGTYFHTEMQIGDAMLAERSITLKGKQLNLDEVLAIITETLNIKYEARARDTIVFKAY